MGNAHAQLAQCATDAISARDGALIAANARIMMLEAALRPFAQALSHIATEDIEPHVGLRIRRERGKEGRPDFRGADLVRAREALR